MSKKPNGYWTKERCHEEALKYKTKSEFERYSSSAYNISLRKKWINDICGHMKPLKVYNKNWTKEKIFKESLKYSSRTELIKNNSNIYYIAKINGWWDEICLNLEPIHKPFEYWTKEKCNELSLLCKSRTEFRLKYNGAYSSANKNGWLYEICSHMIQYRNNYGGYAYEFSDNHVYVGITSRSKNRNRQHLTRKESAVFKHIKYTGLIPIRKQLFEYVIPEEAKKLEEYWVNYYKNNSWNILNISHTGSLGGMVVIWTKEKCQEEALKYENRYEFWKKCGSAHGASLKNGWLDEICSHMKPPYRKNYWIKEKCHEVALKCKSKSEFQNKYSQPYKLSLKNDWLDEICSHMIQSKNPSNYWTKERCQCVSVKCKKKSEFRIKYGSAYNSAIRCGFLNEICSHMKEIKKPNGYWDYKKCKEESLKYKSRSEFNKSVRAYNVSRKNGWLDEFFPKNK